MGTTATLKFYINGKLDTTNSITLTGVDTGGDLYIGDWVGTGPGTQDWAGKLDEIRISRVDRNAGWINTEYNNQQNPDTFRKLGNQVHRINQISMITNLSHAKVANGTIRILQSTRCKQSINSVFQWFLEHYSHLFRTYFFLVS